MALTLRRKIGQRVIFHTAEKYGEDIVVVLEKKKGHLYLTIDAPMEIDITRDDSLPEKKPFKPLTLQELTRARRKP